MDGTVADLSSSFSSPMRRGSPRRSSPRVRSPGFGRSGSPSDLVARMSQGFSSARASSFRSSYSSPARDRTRVGASPSPPAARRESAGQRQQYEHGQTRFSSPTPSTRGIPSRRSPIGGDLGDSMHSVSQKLGSPTGRSRRGSESSEHSLRGARQGRDGGDRSTVSSIRTVSAQRNVQREETRRKENTLREQRDGTAEKREQARLMGTRLGRLGSGGQKSSVVSDYTLESWRATSPARVHTRRGRPDDLTTLISQASGLTERLHDREHNKRFSPPRTTSRASSPYASPIRSRGTSPYASPSRSGRSTPGTPRSTSRFARDAVPPTRDRPTSPVFQRHAPSSYSPRSGSQCIGTPRSTSNPGRRESLSSGRVASPGPGSTMAQRRRSQDQERATQRAQMQKFGALISSELYRLNAQPEDDTYLLRGIYRYASLKQLRQTRQNWESFQERPRSAVALAKPQPRARPVSPSFGRVARGGTGGEAVGVQHIEGWLHDVSAALEREQETLQHQKRAAQQARVSWNDADAPAATMGGEEAAARQALAQGKQAVFEQQEQLQEQRSEIMRRHVSPNQPARMDFETGDRSFHPVSSLAAARQEIEGTNASVGAALDQVRASNGAWRAKSPAPA